MKNLRVLINIFRIIVGALFIISGFIKLNDPIGFSYKLEEYFSPGVLNLPHLAPYSLGIAIILVLIELLLGISLIVGYLKKSTIVLLIVMILFFTFLTFYSAYYNKVTDCGCFGDALHLTPWQSFGKDVVLLVMILFLAVGQKYIEPFFTTFGRSVIVFISFLAAMSFGYHVLMHLPMIDFRPYKVGVNIAKGMEVPKDAPKAIYDYHWKFLELNGKKKTITTQGKYPNTSGEFLGVDTEMVQEGYVPPIHDFSITKNDKDFTKQFLNTENLMIVIAYNLQKTEWNGWPEIKAKTDEALKKGYTVIGLTASDQAEINNLRERQKISFDFYLTDETVLKTIVRGNPALLILNKGTIVQKKHWNDVDGIELQTLPTARPSLDLSLKRKLDTITRMDTLYKTLLKLSPKARQVYAKEQGLPLEDLNGDLEVKQEALDTSNLAMIKTYLDRGIYPGKDMVGTPTNLVALNIIKHNPGQIPQYLDLFKQAGRTGQIPFTFVATVEDQYLMMHGKPQVYGTQARMTNNESFIWPINNPAQVNARRKNAGFKTTVESYAQELLGKDYEYRPLTLADVKASNL